MLCRLTLIFYLLFTCAISSAGHYNVQFSGGGYIQVTDSNGNRSQIPYTRSPSNDPESYVEFSALKSSLSPGSTAEANGTITATYTWVEDFPDEPTPEAVVVRENSSVSYQGTAGSVDNNLGSPNINLNPNPSSADEFGPYGYCAGFRNNVISNPGESFVTTVKPAGNVTPAARNSVAYWNSYLWVRYSVKVAPIRIEMTGVRTASSTPAKHVLVGQRVRAKLTCALATFKDYVWDIGGDYFKRWEREANDKAATVIDVSEDDRKVAEPEWVWIRAVNGRSSLLRPITSVDISVKATPISLDGVESAPIDVKMSVNLERPIPSLEVDIRNDHVFKYSIPGDNTTGGIFAEDANQYAAASFEGTVVLSSSVFASSTGNQWLFVQTHTAVRKVEPGPLVDINETASCLDGGFPYAKNLQANSGGPFPLSINYTDSKAVGDNPRQGLGPGLSYDINDQFVMTTMFKPFDNGLGSEYVPMLAVRWEFKAIGNRASAFVPWPAPTTLSVKLLESLQRPPHPQWVKIL